MLPLSLTKQSLIGFASKSDQKLAVVPVVMYSIGQAKAETLAPVKLCSTLISFEYVSS